MANTKADGKEALLNETPEVTYPKGFHLFLANRKSSKFYLMKKGMLHAYTYNGATMPQFGLGLFIIPDGKVTYNSVRVALRSG